MLAVADKNGEIQASIPGLARIAGVPVDDCRLAIAKFLSPDLDSRTKDDEGRRIENIDGGWSLLNFRKYREMASKEDSQSQEAARKARYRAKLARNNTQCPANVPNVPNVPPVSTLNLHIAEAEAEAEAEALNTSIQPPAPPSLHLESDETQSLPVLTVQQIEVASWIGRRAKTRWSAKELKAWASVAKPIDSEDWQALQWYYTKSGCQYLRRDLLTLLNNWTGEIDRAKNYNPDSKL
jgi:hypothetical protein